MIRLIGLTQGKVNDALASSGLNLEVFGACARRMALTEVLDISLQGWRRYWNALTHWRPDRDAWRERFDLNTWSFEQLSRQAGQALACRRGTFDVALQLKTLYSPGTPPGEFPYALLLDNTYALSERFYPTWAPMRGKERERWLEMERRTYQRAMWVFARTEWVRRSLIDDYGLPPERAIYAGTGSHFDPASIPENRVADDDGRTILFVGKETKRKGLSTLLEAFAVVRREFPEARLVVVGRELSIQQAGVEALGKVTDRNRLRQLYQQASLFALPALFEPCGNVITEAMAYQLPCIVSNAGGLSELVEEGLSGYIIPPQRPDLLAERILRLLNDEALRRQMGRKARQRICDELNWDRVAGRIQAHLELAASENMERVCIAK